MQHVLETGKRVLSVAVAAATIMFSAGATLLTPSVADAASAGDLIKGTSLSTVYYYGHDGYRYTFPNEKTFMTWYSDFSDVVTISDSSLAAISLAGNVVYRPGSRWVKITSAPEVYVVSTDGVIRHIDGDVDADGNSVAAADFAGSNWASMIDDVPDVFFTDYTVGAPLMEAEAFDGMLYMDGGEYFMALDGEKREVSSAGRSANNLQTSFFLDGTGIDDSSLSAGDEVTGELATLVDPAQTVEDDTVTTGDVTVSLASSTPAAASIPDQAYGVEVATFAFAAEEDTEIDLLTVKLGGFLTVTDIDNVYLYEGDARLTDAKSFNSSTREATFGALNFAVEGGETGYITVVVDMADAGTASTFAVSIPSAASVEAGGDVAGSFPVTGRTMTTIDSSEFGAVTINDNTNPTDPALGDADAKIADFNLEETSGNEDVSFEAITLKIDDSDDHSNFALYADIGNELLAEGESIGNDLVLFVLDEAYAIEAGDEADFFVTADIGGEVTDTIDTYLDQIADLSVVGDEYGYNVPVTSSYGSASANTVTVQGGELTIADNSANSADVMLGAENVEFLAFSLTAASDMTVNSFDFTIDDEAASTDLSTDPLTDIRLINAETGTLVAGPLSLGAGANSQTLSFSDEFSLDAGETLELAITADVDEDVAADADSFSMTLDVSSFDIEYAATGEAVAAADIVPSTDIAGNAMTIVASSLTVSLASVPSGTSTYVRGTQDVDAATFNFVAGNGGDITVSDVTVKVYVDEDSAGTFTLGRDDSDADTVYVNANERISSCSLYDAADDSLVSGPESITSATAGTLLFEDFSWTVTAGDTGRLELICDLASVDPSDADDFAFEIVDASTDVTARDEANDVPTISGSANTSETRVIAVSSAGTLTLSASSDLPTADFLLTGSSATTVSKFRFDAANEALVIDRLTVEELQAAADGQTADAYANNISLVKITYPTATGTSYAEAALSTSEKTFNGLSFYVAKDSYAEVSIAVTVPATDRSGGSATSNERIRMGISADDANEFRATGQGSSETLDHTAISVATPNGSMNKFVVRETMPTFAISSSTPTGNITAGNNEVFRFNVQASSNETVILNTLTFALTLSDAAATQWNQCVDGVEAAANITPTDFSLLDITDGGTAVDVDADWDVLDATGAVLMDDGATTCTTATDVAFAQVHLTTPETVAAGATRVYALKFNSTGADVDDSMQVTLVNDPIVSTFLAADDLGESDVDATDVTLTMGAASTYQVGDVLCMDTDNGNDCDSTEERMFVVVDAGATLTVIRGYLGTTPDGTDGNDVNERVFRLPGAMLWQDDGSAAITAAGQEYYGAHLVGDALPISGQALAF